MIFTSIEFIVFFGLVFVLYHWVESIKIQNIIIIIAGCIFYGWWSISFLILLLSLSVLTFVAAIVIDFTRTGSLGINNDDPSFVKAIFILSLFLLLGCLFYFKYINFFLSNFGTVISMFGFSGAMNKFSVVLPLAISFHTFQLIGYLVDVYRGTYETEKDFISFIAFSFFFPQLVAGPIERADHLLEQFKKPRELNTNVLSLGYYLVVFGYFSKIVIADSAAIIVDAVFVKNQYNGLSVLLGTILFGIQIYADFLGYSLIAKGSAALLGFRLIWNFNMPYWSTTPQEFWQRWHISLSSWIRDYLYIPLGGNRRGNRRKYMNILISMGLCGLWHGAAWNYVLWGFYHGAILVLQGVFGIKTFNSKIRRIFSWTATMIIVFIGWYIFRSSSAEVFSATFNSLANNWEILPLHKWMLLAIICLSLPMALFEYWQTAKNNLNIFAESGSTIKYIVAGIMLFLTVSFTKKVQISFVYFVF